ncbi:MAG: hypothetical protein IJM51_02510 [Clostridia bacterium]|nr:hypothetical protein [Clostridia bacterium]
MNENKKTLPVRMAVTVIYVIGILMTAYLGVKCFLPPTSEPDPMAMIPFTENERAFILMAFGFPFMLASCLSVIWAYGLRKSAKPRRNTFLALIPAVIDGIPFLVVAGIILIMLVEGYLEALGILP